MLLMIYSKCSLALILSKLLLFFGLDGIAARYMSVDHNAFLFGREVLMSEMELYGV